MSNSLANRKYVEQLEGDMKKLKQEKTAAEVRLHYETAFVFSIAWVAHHLAPHFP